VPNSNNWGKLEAHSYYILHKQELQRSKRELLRARKKKERLKKEKEEDEG